MCLVLVKEATTNPLMRADDLGAGTWFTDNQNQIYAIVYDDKSGEKRILCAGNFYSPFIPNIPLKEFQVSKILQVGTLLKISKETRYGEGDE